MSDFVDLVFSASGLRVYAPAAAGRGPRYNDTRYSDLPTSVDAMEAALTPWRNSNYFAARVYTCVPRQLIIDLGVPL